MECREPAEPDSHDTVPGFALRQKVKNLTGSTPQDGGAGETEPHATLKIMRRTHGITMLELVAAISIAGVLFGVAAFSLNPARTSVRQAAQVLASNVTLARLEAIRANGTAGLQLTSGGDGGYVLCIDANTNASCDAGEVLKTVTFGSKAAPHVKLADSTIAGGLILFDRRGIPIGNVSGTITLTNGGSSTKVVAVSPTGRAAVK